MKPTLDPTENLFDYFHRRVGDAYADASVTLSEDTRLYLARLLAERARADLRTLPETTLAELYARAAGAPPRDQVRAYRELGDRSLYVLGCFRESLDRRGVGPDYYAGMGAAAYHRVHRALERWFAAAFGPVFRELALCFEGCVELLDRVRDRHDEDHPDVLVRLYRQWQDTGSPEAARRLRALGVVVDDALPS